MAFVPGLFSVILVPILPVLGAREVLGNKPTA